jgi:tetratricopeptide (TPR) repeat protein
VRRIALHDYLSQIEGLLDENRLPEAAAHCHFVLQQYPRHIDTYRLFGRALLEQQLFDEATDVFERLLSADPEDLISHAGLALAYNENRDLERAIWHMERSFEIDPYNRAVQDELKKLYIRRDGDTPPRLSLTRASLGRLHLRASLYGPATLTFTQLLAEKPERVDLRLALADTLYWDSRAVEAAELCQQILVELPYCIKANAILADAWLRGDRVDEARVHLQRVQALTLLDRAHLNPDTTLGRALSNSRIQLPETVQVEVLDESLTIVQGMVESTSWQNQMATAVVDGEQLPDWLLEVGSPDAELQADKEFEPELDSEPEEIMDWLEEAATAEPVAFALEPDPLETKDTSEEVVQPPAGDHDIAEDLLIAAAISEEFLDKVDEETVDPDETVLMAVDDIDALADGSEFQATTAENDDGADSIMPESRVDRAKEEAPNAPWDDGPLMAIDDLRAHIESEGESEGGGAAPEWLGELAEGSEVADELPDWLYEAVGLEAADYDNVDEMSLPSQDKAIPDVSEVSSANSEDPDSLDDAVFDELEAQDAERDRPLAKPEHHGQSAGDEVPDWLLAADDVLEDLPDGLADDSKDRHPEATDLEEETATWLNELAEQLGGLGDDPSVTDEAQDAQ